MEMGVATQQSILVSTDHIHWDPEFCDVKLIQVQTSHFKKGVKRIELLHYRTISCKNLAAQLFSSRGVLFGRNLSCSKSTVRDH